MNYTLYSDVILLQDLPAEGLAKGDIGLVVEKHEIAGMETGYSVEFFDMLGSTVALVTLPMSCFRSPSRTDRPTVRPMATIGKIN
jgi:Domain of unknown function (DUF4926)